MFWTNFERKSKHTFYTQLHCFSENRAIYKIMWKNIVQPDRPQITTCRMRIACWITKDRIQTRTRDFSWGKRRPVRKADDLPPS